MPGKHRGLLFVLSGNMLIDAVEVSVMIVALPSIAADLRLSPAASQWLISGFAFGFGGLLLAGGRVTGRVGRRRGYLAALLVFAVASLFGGLVNNVALLIATRVLKGVCVAMTAPTGLAIISATFEEGPARDRAVSIYTLFGASGFSAGLVLSGVLTELSWRWTLLFPVPVAIVLFLFCLRLLPPDGPAARPLTRFSLPGHGSLLRASVCAAALNGSYWGFLFLCTLDLQSRSGWPPLLAGLALLPASLPLAVSALFSGRMLRRWGTARLIAFGAAAPPVGYLTYPTAMLPALLLVGTGFVLSFAALHVHATTDVPAVDRGTASRLYQASVQLGGALVLTLVAVTAAGDMAPAGDGPSMTLVTAVGVVGLLAAVTGLRAARVDLNKG